MKSPIAILFLTFFSSIVFGQSTGINNRTPNSKAALDVVASGNQGMLIPRISDSQRQAIANPPTGLICYSTTDNLIWYYNGSNWVTIPNNAINAWSQSGSNVILTNSTQNVGIGVTPIAKLEVRGDDDSNTNLAFRISNSTESNLMTIDNAGNVTIPKLTGPGIVQTDAAGNLSVKSNPSTSTGLSYKVAFWTDASTLTYNEYFHWDNTNNRLGIGTTLPTSPLTVKGTSTKGINLLGASDQNLNIYHSDNNLNFESDNPMEFFPNGGGLAMHIDDGDLIANVPLTVKSKATISENVGIGTTTIGVEPGAKRYLTVSGTTSTDNSFASIEIQGGQGTIGNPIGRLDFISNSSVGNSAITRIESIISSGAQFRGDMLFYTRTGNTFTTSSLTEKMRITASGNVGIGTPSPDATLDVEGKFKLGTSGSQMNEIIHETTPSKTITYSGNSTNVYDFTVSGAQLGSSVVVSPNIAMGGPSSGIGNPGLAIAWAYVSSANNVKVAITNLSNTTGTATISFYITVFR